MFPTAMPTSTHDIFAGLEDLPTMGHLSLGEESPFEHLTPSCWDSADDDDDTTNGATTGTATTPVTVQASSPFASSVAPILSDGDSCTANQFVRSTFTSTAHGTVSSLLSSVMGELPGSPCDGSDDSEETMASGCSFSSASAPTIATPSPVSIASSPFFCAFNEALPPCLIWARVGNSFLFGLLAGKLFFEAGVAQELFKFEVGENAATKRREAWNRNFKGLTDSRGVKSATAKTFLFRVGEHQYNMYEVHFSSLDVSLLEVDPCTGDISATGVAAVARVSREMSSKPFARNLLGHICGSNKVEVDLDWVTEYRSRRDDDVRKYNKRNATQAELSDLAELEQEPRVRNTRRTRVAPALAPALVVAAVAAVAAPVIPSTVLTTHVDKIAPTGLVAQEELHVVPTGDDVFSLYDCLDDANENIYYD